MPGAHRRSAGNDLGMFMDGPLITVHGNVQDGVANTMNNGRICIHAVLAMLWVMACAEEKSWSG
jgi:glutamate synthase domain-containing protein 3